MNDIKVGQRVWVTTVDSFRWAIVVEVEVRENGTICYWVSGGGCLDRSEIKPVK